MRPHPLTSNRASFVVAPCHPNPKLNSRPRQKCPSSITGLHLKEGSTRSKGSSYSLLLSMCTGTGSPGPTPTLRTTPSSARYARCSFNKSTQRRCLLGWRHSIVRTGRCKTSVGSGSTPRTLFTIWVLLCTKCFAVHKPGQLTLTKVVQEPCPGASRAHEKRCSLWAQKYLEETTAPGTLFGAGIPKQQKAPLLGPSAQQVEAQPPSAVPTADGHTDRTQVGCGPHASPDAKKAAGASTTRTPQPVPQLPKASSFFKGPTLPASVTPTSPAGLGSKQGSQLEHLGSTRSNHREPNLLQAHTPARPNSELFPQGKQSRTPTSSRPQVGGRREEGASPSIASYFQPCHGRGSGSSIAGSTPGRGGGYGNKRKGPAPPPTPSPSQTGSGTAQTEAQEERKTPPPKGGRTGVAGRTAGKKAGRTTSSSPAKLAGTSQNVQKKTPAQPKTGKGPRASSGHRVDLDPNLSHQGTRKKRRPQCTAPKPATGACLPPARRTKVGRRPAPSVAEFLQPQPQPPTKGSPPSG